MLYRKPAAEIISFGDNELFAASGNYPGGATYCSNYQDSWVYIGERTELHWNYYPHCQFVVVNGVEYDQVWYVDGEWIK